MLYISNMQLPMSKELIQYIMNNRCTPSAFVSHKYIPDSGQIQFPSCRSRPDPSHDLARTARLRMH